MLFILYFNEVKRFLGILPFFFHFIIIFLHFTPRNEIKFPAKKIVRIFVKQGQGVEIKLFEN